MAAAPVLTTMSVEEYLRTPFRPDVDYVDGVIEERNLGEFDHGKLQGALFRLLDDNVDLWNVHVVPETRVQITETRFRVPDVCVTDARFPVEQIIHRAPLLCIEVISPKDCLRDLLERVRDFHRIGVTHAWIFDPATGKVWVSTPDRAQEHPGGLLSVPGTKIVFDPASAFARAARRR